MTRILYLLLIFFFLSGCAPREIVTPDFLYVTPEKKDTVASLAKKHLGSASLAWKIQESNDISIITPGEQLIIPTKPVRPGGLTAKGYQQIPVLSYHNFTAGKSKDLLTMTKRNFKKQLDYLKREKYHTLTLEQLEDFLDLGQVPKNSVLLTIDDGWISSYKIAYPMLQQYGFNATLFIPTNYISNRSSNTISWEQIREMINDNTIDIQCHTKGHRDLNQIKYGESMQSYINSIDDQVASSKKIINDKIGTQVSALAYPYGNTNPVAIEILKNNGYKTAFTVKRKSNPFYSNNFLLNRSMIYSSHSMRQFQKNIKVFNELKLGEAEPIDKLMDIRKIAYSNPEQYEQRQQWRTALLAWKMRRDWLLAQAGGLQSAFASKSDEQKKAEEKIAALEKKVKEIAQNHYLAATTSRNNKTIRKELLRSLLYDPYHQDALAMLKDMPLRNQLTHYKVGDKETTATIARKLYKKKSNNVLIPLFNRSIKDDSDLFSGQELLLPTVAALNIIKPSATTRCQVKLTKPSSEFAEDLYTAANALFSQDKISQAIVKLKKAICLNPNYDMAKEMLDMLMGL